MSIDLSKANDAIINSDLTNEEKGSLLAFVGKLHKEDKLKDVNVSAEYPTPIIVHTLLATMRQGDWRTTWIIVYLVMHGAAVMLDSRLCVTQCSPCVFLHLPHARRMEASSPCTWQGLMREQYKLKFRSRSLIVSISLQAKQAEVVAPTALEARVRRPVGLIPLSNDDIHIHAAHVRCTLSASFIE